MKHLLFILLLIPFFSFAQSKTAFKGANTIIIQTQDSSHQIIKKFIPALSNNGFSVANADKETGVINTNPKALKSDEIILNALIIEGSKIVLTGNFKTNYTTATSQITFRGMKNSSFLNTWEQMKKVALSYPNATFTYEKR